MRITLQAEAQEQLADSALTVHRCLPPARSVVFDTGSLFPDVPSVQLRLAPETLVGFRAVGTEHQMSAAAGLVNGSSIRRETWPRRAPAVSIVALQPIALGGIWLAGVGQSSIAAGAIWGGPSILRWGRYEPDRGDSGTSMVRLISDGYEAETFPPKIVDDDIVIRCRLPMHARWLRIISPALLPPGQNGSTVEQKRFGIAVVELSSDAISVPLDAPGLVSGFYPIEGDAPRRWRWTNGSGLIALEPCPSERMFSIRFTNWHEMLEA